MAILIPLDRIRTNRFETRTNRTDEHIAEIAASIASAGRIIQPPTARIVAADGGPHPDAPDALLGNGAFVRDICLVQHGGYVELASGGGTRLAALRLLHEREAAETAGGLFQPAGRWAVMPVELAAFSDDEMEAAAWIENAHRRDLDSVDRAAAIAARIERHGWTHEQAGEALGLNRTTISNIVRWFHAFSTEGDECGRRALGAMRDGKLSEHKARAIAGAFLAAAEAGDEVRSAIMYHRAVYDTSLCTLVSWATEADERAVRAAAGRYVAAIEAEVERRRQEREPALFEADAPDERGETSEGDELDGPFYEGDAEPHNVPGPNKTPADDLHDRAEETAPDAAPEADFHNRADPQTAPVSADVDGPSSPLTDAPGDEAHLVAEAAVAVLATIPEPARRLLTPLLTYAYGEPDASDAEAWARSAVASVVDYVVDTSPREAADEMGLAVEWPEADDDFAVSRESAQEEVAALVAEYRAARGAEASAGRAGKTVRAKRERATLAAKQAVDDALVAVATDLSPADARAIANALRWALPAEASLDAPAGLNARERKLLAAVRDAGARGHAPRESDRKAAERLAALGMVAWLGHSLYLGFAEPDDDFDDGGAALKAVAAAQGLAPFDAEVSVETSADDATPYPACFPMVPRLQHAGIPSLQALRDDIAAKGGPLAWVIYAVQRYDGLGETRAKRVTTAALPDGYDHDRPQAGRALDYACPACAAGRDELCRKPGGGQHKEQHAHADRQHVARRVLEAADVSVDTSAEPEPADERPGDAADPVAATRAAMKRGDDPALIRRDLAAAYSVAYREMMDATPGANGDGDERDRFIASVDRCKALNAARELLVSVGDGAATTAPEVAAP